MATWPSIFSAIAALCSAITAFITMRISRRNLLESIRPELTVSGWSRSEDDTGKFIIRFNSIRNSGRGIAYDITTNVPQPMFNEPPHMPKDIMKEPYSVFSTNVPILSQNETMEVVGGAYLNWVNANEALIKIQLTLHFTNSMGHDFVTEYSLAVNDNNMEDFNFRSNGKLASGLWLLSRRTRKSTFFKPTRYIPPDDEQNPNVWKYSARKFYGNRVRWPFKVWKRLKNIQSSPIDAQDQ